MAEGVRDIYRSHDPVLFESTVREGQMVGFTDNYIRVAMPYRSEVVNRIVAVELGEGRTTSSGYAGGEECLSGRPLEIG